MGWRQREEDGSVDVVSVWRDDDGGYPLTILLFLKKTVYNS
jgi:hypothetical protein